MKDIKSEKISYRTYNLKGVKLADNNLVVPLTQVEDQLKILAQAVKVYLTNQIQGTVSTKTRGEVSGSTRKIYRQKGTGRARHGDIKSPIFVGGGIIFGPRPRRFNLHLPTKMKKKAFLLSFIDKVKNNQLIVIEDLDKMSPKTAEFFNMLKAIFAKELKDTKFLVIDGSYKNVYLASRNIQNVEVLGVENVNTFKMLTHQKIIVDRSIFEKLLARVGLK